jgi:glycosyltransferase involved in cell wall biosynthesis
MASPSDAAASISCVMPVRNGAAYIAEAVASVARQSLPPMEIIVVDDGGTDDSPTLALAAGDGLVRVVTQPPLGVDAARNRGREAARGELIAFFDADDIMPQSSLAALHAALVVNPTWQAVFGRWRNFWIDGLEAESQAADSAHLRGEQAGLLLTSGLVRKTLCEQAGPFAVDQGWQGLQLWLGRLQSSGVPLGRIEQVTLHRRIHANNMSRGKTLDEVAELAFALHRMRRPAPRGV